jgi:diguanylate cyclase (GGDEF)-like protein
VRFAHRILRQRLVRYGAALIFFISAWLSLVLLLGVGASFEASVALAAVVGLTSVAVALAPTETMPYRWFYLLPVIIAAETCAAMFVGGANTGAYAGTYVFIGAAAPLIAPSVRGLFGQLSVASVLLAVPVVAGSLSAWSAYTVLIVFLIMWGLGGIVAVVWAYAEDVATQLDELAQIDALTGVGNRRMLDDRLDYELVRHLRSGAEMSLIALDLNGFKQVNDTVGHSAGDAVLQQVATALQGAVRAQDTVVRPGGDEFCVLAPEAGPVQAADIVARIHAALSGIAVHDVSAAIGVAVFPRDATAARELYDIADERQRADKPYAVGRDFLSAVA